MKTHNKLLIAGFIAAAAALAVRAADIYATACSAAAINTAIGQASNGDRIIVPAGDTTSSTTITLTKALTIQGQARA